MKWTLTCLIAGTAVLGLSGGQSLVQAGPAFGSPAWLQQNPEPAPAGGQPAPAAQQPPAAPAQPTGELPPAAVPPAEEAFAPDQLEQLVAPIALYPDALLMQILMASTYPLQVVEADRWVKANPGVTGAALDEALKGQEWDPSVKSLIGLPDVLKKMSENLDWTQDLGDAFLGQQSELMDTVQKMRGLAYESGNLKSSEQQTVTQQEDKIIVIESQDPEVVYVPTYSSTVVYGSSWGYPSYYYPPMYPYYPPGYGLVSFGIGMAVGGAIWGDCDWGWGDTDVNIDVDRYNEFNRNTNINSDRTQISNRSGERGGKAGWEHNSANRKGVNYRSQDVAQRHGASAGSNRVTKDQARGRSTASTGARQTGSTGARQTGSTGARQTGTTGARTPGSSQASGARTSDRATTGSRSSASSRPSSSSRSSGSGYSGSGRSSSSAMSGSRSSSMDRASSSRGASSRGTSSFGGSRGGGARGGGGRRR